MGRVYACIALAIAIHLTPAYGEKPVPDNQDIRNEFFMLNRRVDRVEARLQALEDRVADFKLWLLGSVGVFVLTFLAQLKLSQRATEKLSDFSEERIRSLTQESCAKLHEMIREAGCRIEASVTDMTERLRGEQKEVERLRSDTAAHVISEMKDMFERPSLIKKETIDEIVRLLCYESVLTTEAAERMRRRADGAWG